MKLQFHPEAELELLEAVSRYDLDVPGLGERFGTEVQRVADLLLEHPNVGKEVGPGRRKFSLHRFHFTLIYAPHPRKFSMCWLWHMTGVVQVTVDREDNAN